MKFLIWKRVKNCLNHLKMNIQTISRNILITLGIAVLLLLVCGWGWYTYEMMQDQISEKKFILITISVLSIFLLTGIGLVVYRIYWHDSSYTSTHEKNYRNDETLYFIGSGFHLLWSCSGLWLSNIPKHRDEQ